MKRTRPTIKRRAPITNRDRSTMARKNLPAQPAAIRPENKLRARFDSNPICGTDGCESDGVARVRRFLCISCLSTGVNLKTASSDSVCCGCGQQWSVRVDIFVCSSHLEQEAA